MTSIIIAFFTLALALFMATDNHCQKNEKNSIYILLLVGTTCLAIGFFTFEFKQISQISVKDWTLLGFLPITLLYLKIKSKLVEIQSEIIGKKSSLLELNLELIEDTVLIKKFKLISKTLWSYVALILIIVFFE